MKPHILILTDPYGKPAFAPRLRFLCDYLVKQGYFIEVYTEQFESISFAHAYPIYEMPTSRSKLSWLLCAIFSLLTDWRNRHFSRWVQTATKDKDFDLVFCTTFSTFPLRAAKEVAAKKHIPFIADIRDLDEQVPNAQYQYHRQWWTHPFRAWYRNINIHRRNQVLPFASAVTTVSPWHVDFIHNLNPHVHLIYNGFDSEQFYAQDLPSSKFLITYIGRLYEFQQPALQLVSQAVRELNISDIELNLHFPNSRYLPITEVGDEIRRSSVVLVFTSQDTHGMMTTKFFEALGCEKPILCIPSDNGLLAQTIQATNAGIATDDVEAIKAFIVDKYKEWKSKGFTRQPVKNKEQFNRQTEAQQFEQLLLNLCKRKSLS